MRRREFMEVLAGGQLRLISANKNRIGNVEWSPDDYEMRDGAPDGRHVGRIYKLERWRAAPLRGSLHFRIGLGHDGRSLRA